MIKSNKYLAVIFFLLLLLPVHARAQTAAEMDTMLGATEVSAAGAARFVLGAAELLPPGLSGAAAESAAYEMARSKGWIKAAASDAISLKETAFLLMNAFELKGGAMYSLFHNPRYAYREMVYRKLIQGASDPDMKVSGIRFLQILGRTLSYSGENELVDAELRATGGVN